MAISISDIDNFQSHTKIEIYIFEEVVMLNKFSIILVKNMIYIMEIG